MVEFPLLACLGRLVARATIDGSEFGIGYLLLNDANHLFLYVSGVG
ncbi:hypothetical protein P3T17_006917 [Paraburkholderia sp. GAS82]|jgi:hypothetical protein